MSTEQPRVPGTQQLIDANLSHGRKRGADASELILVPQPSSDPEEPLNWLPRRKLLNTLCYSVYTFFNGVAGSNLYSVETPLSQATGVSLSTINSGTGYLFLLAGWSLLFWQPFALQYGKRLTYIISLLGLLGCTMWTPYITTDGQWYGRSILTGFFAAPIEALPELSVTDLYFAHERGQYMGLYAFTLVGSNFFAPLIFGFVNDRQGFRWVFYWTAIFLGAGVLFLFFLLEETNYDRPRTANSHASKQDDPSAAQPRLTVADHYASLPANPPRKPYLRKLSLKDRPRPFTFLTRLKLQLKFLTYAVPLYAGFAYGSTLIWFNVLNATSSLVLSAPPYSFTPAIVGLCYLAPLLGTALGFLTTGRLSDMLVVRLARRNGGMMEPEQRLYVFAASSVLVPVGLVVWGVGSARGVHWVGLLFAMGMLAFANTCGAALGVSYLVDCYREMSGDALTAVIIVRNTMGFAIGYGITPWIVNLGQENAFISAACVGFAVSLHWIVMVLAGKRLRRWNATRYWKVVDEAEEKGIAHS